MVKRVTKVSEVIVRCQCLIWQTILLAGLSTAALPKWTGEGDTFTSVITGSLMQGDSLPMALDRATQFILQGIRATFGYEYDNREGILLEKVLHNLDMPIQMASYELI